MDLSCCLECFFLSRCVVFEVGIRNLGNMRVIAKNANWNSRNIACVDGLYSWDK